MADLNAALMQQVLDVAERQRKSDVQHNRQAYDLGPSCKIAKWIRFCHLDMLRNRPARLK
jgi:hypothetical protein